MSKNNGIIKDELYYGKDVLPSTILLAAQEIAGVHSLAGKGVKTVISGNNIDVNIFVNILSGYTVSDVAFRIQDNVRRSVETMTVYRIAAVNVKICGVCIEERI